MRKIRKHPIKKTEISFIEFKNNRSKKFKVTKRIPELSVAETKIFRSKKKAKKQFEE